MTIRGVKIFTGNRRSVEKEANSFLLNNPNLKILNTLQSESDSGQGWSITLTILYEK